jgi:death-on-curing protein
MSERPIRFLGVETVLRLHEIAIADQGGDPSLRDAGLLDSALAMPQQQFGGQYLHNSIPAMAAAYAFHIAKNHPFVDGNKRAALASLIAFLTLNGWRFDASEDDAEQTILALAAGQIEKQSLTAWVMSNCHEKPRMELRDFLSSVSYAQVHEFAGAVLASGSDPEAGATIAEARADLPIVRELEQLRESARASDNAAGYAAFNAMLVYTVALHRIAEDMGYDW